MFIAVDVNATFNTVGDIKPLYIRLEDDKHKMHVYKIIDVITKEVECIGLHNIIMFTCSIQIDDTVKNIKIKYHSSSNKWMLVNI